MVNKTKNIIKNELFPEKEEIFSWIEDLTKWGHRKTGTEESRKSAAYIKNKFTEFGLENIIIENPITTIYKPEIWKLTVQGEEIPSYFINFTFMNNMNGSLDTGESGIKAELVYIGEGREEDFQNVDVKGKIVVSEIRFLDADTENLKQYGTGASFTYDPRNTLGKGPVGKNVYTPVNWPYNYFNAMKRGAVGFIGILTDYFDHCEFHNENYTDLGYAYGFDYMSIPGQWISKTSGDRIKNIIKNSDQEVDATLQMKVAVEEGESNIISGILPGKSDEIILIHSHHDAIFDGAVQDASGTSEVLALAKYFSQFSKEEREKTLMFAAMDTHYTDYRGHLGFIENRKKNNDNIILDVVIEHIGKEVVIGRDGKPVTTGEVELRNIFVNDNKALLSITKDAVLKHNLERTQIIPVDDGAVEVPSDACYFHKSGIPVISILSGQTYLFDPIDTLEMIEKEQLRPIGLAFAEIVERVSFLDSVQIKKYDKVDNEWLNS